MRYFALLAIGVAFTPPAFAGGPSTAEMIAEIAKSQAEALATYEREITSWQIDYEVKTFGPGGDLLRHAKYTQRYRPDGPAIMTQTVVVDKGSRGGGKDIASAQNKQYRFSLQKTPGSSEWVLSDAKQFGSEAPGKSAPGAAHPYAGAWFARHFYTPDGQLFADVLRDPKFVVKSCSASPANQDWVRVVGELPSGKPKPPALKGWWDFDPAMGYCCRGSEVTSTYKAGNKGYSTVEHYDFNLSRLDAGLITLDSYKFSGHADYSGQIKNAETGSGRSRTAATQTCRSPSSR